MTSDELEGERLVLEHSTDIEAALRAARDAYSTDDVAAVLVNMDDGVTIYATLRAIVATALGASSATAGEMLSKSPGVGLYWVGLFNGNHGLAVALVRRQFLSKGGDA